MQLTEKKELHLHIREKKTGNQNWCFQPKGRDQAKADKKSIMIKHKNLLNEVNADIRKGIQAIEFQFRIYDVDILEVFLEKKDFDLLSKQGGNLTKYNAERKKNDLPEIKEIRNLKVIEKSWKKYLTTHQDDLSNGLVFVPTMGNARVKLTKGLEGSISGVLKGTDVKFKKLTNNLFSTILLYIETEKEEKGDKEKD